MKNRINFKERKYVLPLIVLPFILFISYQITSFMEDDKKEETSREEINKNLGIVKEGILSKNEAYDKLFENTRNSRSMIQEFDIETDSFYKYTDNLNEEQKRFLDSLKYERSKINNQEESKNKEIVSYYIPKEEKRHFPNNNEEDEDFNRSKEIIKMLNSQKEERKVEPEPEEEYDPVKVLKEQMFFIDSLEKTKNPEYKEKMEAERKLKENKDKLDKFLNSSLTVSKSRKTNGFNYISRETENNIIKAVIDENIKGYLGSRIRIRLLEDVSIGKKHKMKKGSFLYAEIAGFTLQRVNLKIVSVMINNEILPINLSIYDMDGLKGLYVPASAYREMLREMGSNSVQGMDLEGGQQGFFTSLASSLFKSASESIVAIIRKNKVTLKYSSYIYLINEKDLRKNEEY